MELFSMEIQIFSLPVFISWFIFTYLTGYLIIFKNWNKKYRPEASSCFMSLNHGTPAFILSIFAIYKYPNSKIHLNFTNPNTALQNRVLDFSIAYFLIDLLHYIVFIPTDVLFIAHHLATLYVLATCRYLFGHGAVAILGILALAEATTTCQNTWSLVRFKKFESEKARRVFVSLSPIFYGYYSFVRGVLGPLYVWKMGWVFSNVNDDVIPKWGWVSWIVVIVAGIVLSVIWVLHLWICLCRERSNKEMKKFS